MPVGDAFNSGYWDYRTTNDWCVTNSATTLIAPQYYAYPGGLRAPQSEPDPTDVDWLREQVDEIRELAYA